ncbi:unnamed protein product [Pleuronectes platessa]|uniref:Uncharacterized protein n=1 Tax=Pleuronectes platessa TaxID=8262 RepID=A0A9N7TPX0_PLEPL|nr:unnamed protein product [Pleuronectes platessa]
MNVLNVVFGCALLLVASISLLSVLGQGSLTVTECHRQTISEDVRVVKAYEAISLGCWSPFQNKVRGREGSLVVNWTVEARDQQVVLKEDT